MADQDMEKLRSEVSQLRSDLQGVTSALKEMAAHRGEETYDQLREHARTVGDQALEAERAFEKHIEERPLISIFLAFVGGLMAGLIVQGRR